MDHYSYTQLATYLQCPLRYKYHYLEGWAEREDKANLIFGRVFQTAVEAQFLVPDAVAFFAEHWGRIKDLQLEYSNGDSWEKMRAQGRQLLERFGEDQRVQIEDGRTDFQVKFRRPLPLRLAQATPVHKETGNGLNSEKGHIPTGCCESRQQPEVHRTSNYDGQDSIEPEFDQVWNSL